MNTKLKYHPAGANPGQAFLLTAFISIMSGVVYFCLDNIFVVGVLILILLESLLPYYIPTYYEIDDKKIIKTYLRKITVIEIKDYEKYKVFKNAITLFPKDIKSKRPVYLPMTPAMMEQFETVLSAALKREEA